MSQEVKWGKIMYSCPVTTNHVFMSSQEVRWRKFMYSCPVTEANKKNQQYTYELKLELRITWVKGTLKILY